MPYPLVTGEGNLTADPEIKWLQSGNAVCNITVASTQRQKNRDTQEWEDKGTTFLRLTLWNEDAEVFVQWASKGAAVRYEGRLAVREFEGRDGGKGTSLELEFPIVVPDPKRMDIGQVTRRQRDGQGQQRQGGGQSSGGGRSQGGQGGGQAWGGQARQQGNQQGMQQGSGWGRTSGGGGQSRGGSWGGQQGGQGGGQQGTAKPDPWASAPVSGGQAGYDDEPPF